MLRLCRVKTYWYSYSSGFPCCWTLISFGKGILASWATFTCTTYTQHCIHQEISNTLSSFSLIFISSAMRLADYDPDCIIMKEKGTYGKVFTMPNFPLALNFPVWLHRLQVETNKSNLTWLLWISPQNQNSFSESRANNSPLGHPPVLSLLFWLILLLKLYWDFILSQLSNSKSIVIEVRIFLHLVTSIALHHWQ